MFNKFNSHRNLSISKYIKQNLNKVKANEKKHQEFQTEFSDLQHISLKKWEKYLLTYSKKYKSIAEVPDRVSASTLDKAKSKVRIKVANFIMVFMILGCLGYIYVGKKRAERGDTEVKRAKEYKEKYLASLKKKEEIQKQT